MKVFDTLVLGAGPCGIRTAIILKEAGLDVSVIEGSTPGGKINIAPRVDNYPGFTKSLVQILLLSSLIGSIKQEWK